MREGKIRRRNGNAEDDMRAGALKKMTGILSKRGAVVRISIKPINDEYIATNDEYIAANGVGIALLCLPAAGPCQCVGMGRDRTAG